MKEYIAATFITPSFFLVTSSGVTALAFTQIDVPFPGVLETSAQDINSSG
jgi:hypothetical protein